MMRITFLNLLALSLLIGLTAACQPRNAAQPSSTSTTDVVDINQPVPLDVGQTQDLSGTLQPNETIHFLLISQAGQRMTVALDGTDVQMAILDQNSQVIADQADLKEWQGVASYSGQYFVRLSPTPGAASSAYNVKLGLRAN